ncbi:hypothetical protein J2S74_001342 [Evansella vedderi]|uniref:Small multi-drug export protein n=1 Tax=Evansella vedderi TaxID=38282 RepID=A0ABT9ZRY5_9BACI|nr:small multi-drug export protein [Evansella vedderi]MDQ0253969.1 hypothetical protein [Evansella vedderi]
MFFETLWQYILIFVMAATPWLEILIVIPIGIGMGLQPFWVGVVSFIGNFLPVILIIYAINWFQGTQWFQKRKEKKIQKQKELAGSSQGDQNNRKKSSKKERAARIFKKYGLPGLALLGPLITGIHLAAIIALSLKAAKFNTAIWMGISLLLWTVVITIASFYSIDWVTKWF